MTASKLTERQAIVLSAFTGKHLCPFHELHYAIEEKLGRVVYTHQFGSPEVWEEIREAFLDEATEMLPWKLS